MDVEWHSRTCDDACHQLVGVDQLRRDAALADVPARMHTLLAAVGAWTCRRGAACVSGGHTNAARRCGAWQCREALCMDWMTKVAHCWELQQKVHRFHKGLWEAELCTTSSERNRSN